MSLEEFESQEKHLLPIIKALNIHLWVYGNEQGICVLISLEIEPYEMLYTSFSRLT